MARRSISSTYNGDSLSPVPSLGRVSPPAIAEEAGQEACAPEIPQAPGSGAPMPTPAAVPFAPALAAMTYMPTAAAPAPYAGGIEMGMQSASPAYPSPQPQMAAYPAPQPQASFNNSGMVAPAPGGYPATADMQCYVLSMLLPESQHMLYIITALLPMLPDALLPNPGKPVKTNPTPCPCRHFPLLQSTSPAPPLGPSLRLTRPACTSASPRGSAPHPP